MRKHKCIKGDALKLNEGTSEESSQREKIIESACYLRMLLIKGTSCHPWRYSASLLHYGNASLSPICLVLCCRWRWPRGNSLPHISYKVSLAANQAAQPGEHCLRRLWQAPGWQDTTVKKIPMWQFVLPPHAAGCLGSRQGAWESDMTHVGLFLGTCSNRTQIIVCAWIGYCPGCRQDVKAISKGDVPTREIRQNAPGPSKGIYIFISHLPLLL